MSLPEIDAVTARVAAVAEAEVLPRFRNLQAGDIRTKTGPDDLVTVADEACERALSTQLMALLPGSRVVGEEAVSADRTCLERLSSNAPVWIIDPVDGTLNFAHGDPHFAVIVALVVGGETVAGWIHDPCGHRTAVAECGQGAWMAGERLAVSRPAADADLIGVAYLRNYTVSQRRHAREDLRRLGQITNMRCVGHEYLRLASGALHYALYSRLMPWDHAAGVLLHREAGGISGYRDGRAYQPRPAENEMLVLAHDSTLWHRVVEASRQEEL